MTHPYLQSPLLHPLLLSRLLGGSPHWLRAVPRQFAPSAAIEESESHVTLRLDLPGVPKSDLAIEVSEDVLSVSGKRTIAGEEHAFARRFDLAGGFAVEQIKAELKDGVLTVTLPRKEEAKPRKHSISIN